MKGIVKWFNSAKGYGFIGCEDGVTDVFVHFSDIQAKGYKELKKDQQVEFELAQGPKEKLQAVNVVVVS